MAISLESIQAQLRAIEAEALAGLAAISAAPALADFKSNILGKKGSLSQILAGLKDLSTADKPIIGAAANEVRGKLEALFRQKSEELENSAVNKALEAERLDISLPGRQRRIGAKHPLSIVRSQLYGIFQELGFAIATGPEAETDFCNFAALNFPPNHPARDMQDTLHLAPGVVLRTHTSSMQTRAMLAQDPPIKVVATGPVYRNDAVDATHSPMFHQMEALYVDRGVHMGHLKGTLELFAKRLMGANTKIRLRPSYFPFTEPSVEVDFSCGFCGGKGCRICKGTGWIEILGAGMVNPRVFLEVAAEKKTEGYRDPELTGFAFGIGIERVAMLFFDIQDIRHFFENDLRFLEQFRG